MKTSRKWVEASPNDRAGSRPEEVRHHRRAIIGAIMGAMGEVSERRRQAGQSWCILMWRWLGQLEDGVAPRPPRDLGLFDLASSTQSACRAP